MADPEDHAKEQQQRVEPTDNDVRDEHSEPVQEQNEINNPGHHESDFGGGSEGDENDNRCDPVGYSEDLLGEDRQDDFKEILGSKSGS